MGENQRGTLPTVCYAPKTYKDNFQPFIYKKETEYKKVTNTSGPIKTDNFRSYLTFPVIQPQAEGG